MSQLVELTRAKLADQSHPHEERAKLIQEKKKSTIEFRENSKNSPDNRVLIRPRTEGNRHRRVGEYIESSKVGEKYEGSTMSVDMTVAQKAAYEKYLADSRNSFDNEVET